MSGISDLYDYSVHELDALLAREGLAIRVVPLSTPEPAARGVNPSPFGSAPAGEGTTAEVIA